jgi:hypothetical protein
VCGEICRHQQCYRRNQCYQPTFFLFLDTIFGNEKHYYYYYYY